jgi:16S rRNA processing protein RimM
MIDHAILIGEITGVFGLKGAVKLKPFVDDPQIFKKLKICQLTDKNGNITQLKVISAKWHSNRWLLQFDGVETPESAMLLRSSRVFINVQNLPQAKADEVYWIHIAGAEVKDTDGATIGTLVDYIETGAHDVLVIESADEGKQRFLISNNPSHVLSISPEDNLVLVDRIGLVLEN